MRGDKKTAEQGTTSIQDGSKICASMGLPCRSQLHLKSQKLNEISHGTFLDTMYVESARGWPNDNGKVATRMDKREDPGTGGCPNDGWEEL